MKKLTFIFTLFFVYGSAQASMEQTRKEYINVRDENRKLEGDFKSCLSKVDQGRLEFQELLYDWGQVKRKKDKRETKREARARKIAVRKMVRKIKAKNDEILGEENKCTKLLSKWSGTKAKEMSDRTMYVTNVILESLRSGDSSPTTLKEAFNLDGKSSGAKKASEE